MEKIREVLPTSICSSDDDEEHASSGQEDSTRDYHKFPVVRPRGHSGRRKRTKNGVLVDPTKPREDLSMYLKSDYVQRLVGEVNEKFQTQRETYQSPCYVTSSGRQVAKVDIPTNQPLTRQHKLEEMAATNTLLSACLKQSGIAHEVCHGTCRILKNLDKLVFLKNNDEQLCSRVTNFDWGIFTTLALERKDQKLITDNEADVVGAIIPKSHVDREKQMRAFRDFDMVLAAGILANIELMNIMYNFFVNFNRNGGFGMRYSWINIDGKIVTISPSPVMIDFNYGQQTKSVPSPSFPIVAMDSILHQGEKDYYFEFVADDGSVVRPGWKEQRSYNTVRAAQAVS